jgi:hypothetical protein
MIEFVSDFRRWFWARPRAHGETIEGRRVSNTELLYDLIYVAVIAQSTMALGNNLTVGGVLDFVVVFALTWIGWVNGSLYLELHGREDGERARTCFSRWRSCAYWQSLPNTPRATPARSSRSPT